MELTTQGEQMLRIILFITLSIMTTQVFAHTECYFESDVKDGTYGFILQKKTVTLFQPYRKFVELRRNGDELSYQGEVVGQIQLNSLQGIMDLGEESNEFKCTVWRTGGRG